MDSKLCKKCSRIIPPKDSHTVCSGCRKQKYKDLCPSCNKNLKTIQSIVCQPCHGKYWAFQRTAERSSKWKGGRIQKKSGYIVTYAPDHPRATTEKYIFEHILVMETKLGRYLYPKETVHHKNGIRNDNRPENLELWSKNHPPGQRVEDLVSWAKEILNLYGE